MNGLALRVVCIHSETQLGNINFLFGCGYQLGIDSGLAGGGGGVGGWGWGWSTFPLCTGTLSDLDL